MYKEVDPRVDFAKMEEEILEFWRINDTFKKSIEQRKDSVEFIFYDGPPFATGLPHFGHFVPGTIKDIIPRYKTMRGQVVERRFGWDCHGLPVEYEMEKELGISGKREIEEFGIAKFNEACRSIVHDPLRTVGGFRQRLQDHGPRIYGVHLVGRKKPLGQGIAQGGILYTAVLSALLDGAL